MPSVSLSNYEPLTRFGISYEIFDARMSYSKDIVYTAAPGGVTQGYPHLGGIQITAEPAEGWSIGVNRLVQFGGGARGGGSLTDVLRALFKPSQYSNLNPNLSVDQKATNQEASVTSSLIFPGRVPFVVYAEYAGEDTSHGSNFLLGNSALSWGIHFPRLAERFDLTLEASEWQNAWYVHSVWRDGMTNDGLVISNWFGDQRLFDNGVGGHSAMARLAWDAWFGGRVELRYRTLQNQVYNDATYGSYLLPALSRDQRRLLASLEGHRARRRVRYRARRVRQQLQSAGGLRALRRHPLRRGLARGRTAATQPTPATAPASCSSRRASAAFARASTSPARHRSSTPRAAPMRTFALGARREVSEHSDLGARIESDTDDGHNLLGVRLIDYRYRFHGPLALTTFVGAARYDLATPAYGIYFGLGLQWRDILPHLDLGIDARYYDNIARDRLLPNDPSPVTSSNRPDSFYDVVGGVVALSYHF